MSKLIQSNSNVCQGKWVGRVPGAEVELVKLEEGQGRIRCAWLLVFFRFRFSRCRGMKCCRGDVQCRS